MAPDLRDTPYRKTNECGSFTLGSKIAKLLHSLRLFALIAVIVGTFVERIPHMYL
jgi:hypothetical protein